MKYFLSIYDIFASWFVFLTRLLTFGILFLIALMTAVVAKPLILDILSSISPILALWFVFSQIC